MADESTEFFSPQGHARYITRLSDPEKDAKSKVEMDRATDTVKKCSLNVKYTF